MTQYKPITNKNWQWISKNDKILLIYLECHIISNRNQQSKVYVVLSKRFEKSANSANLHCRNSCLQHQWIIADNFLFQWQFNCYNKKLDWERNWEIPIYCCNKSLFIISTNRLIFVSLNKFIGPINISVNTIFFSLMERIRLLNMSNLIRISSTSRIF